MVARKQKDQMIGYLEEKLKDPSVRLTILRDGSLVTGTSSDYFLVEDLANPCPQKGLVIAIDDVYKNNALDRVYGIARDSTNNLNSIAFVLLKDGKTFFRSAAQDNHFKAKYSLSLKNYTPLQINQMILFRPEEKFAFGERNQWVQYYQPQSAELPESLETFHFDFVEYDYSHIDNERFQPQDATSEKLFLWEKRIRMRGQLQLQGNGLLCER